MVDKAPQESWNRTVRDGPWNFVFQRPVIEHIQSLLWRMPIETENHSRSSKMEKICDKKQKHLSEDILHSGLKTRIHSNADSLIPPRVWRAWPCMVSRQVVKRRRLSEYSPKRAVYTIFPSSYGKKLSMYRGKILDPAERIVRKEKFRRTGKITREIRQHRKYAKLEKSRHYFGITLPAPLKNYRIFD